MRRQDITYQDKLNELRLDLSHPNSDGICFILLEGETDTRLFRKFFNLENCKVENIPGGNTKLETAVSELIRIYELVIGIRDADFINLETAPYSNKNMFLTDYHDIEMSLVSDDDSISAIVFEYTDIPKINHDSIREKVISTIEQVSLLKWLNYIEDLKIVFEKTGFQDLLSFANLTIDFDQYFDRLLSKSPNAKIVDIDTIKSKINILKVLDKNPYQLCNGHDFVKALTQFIREQGKVRNIGDETVSSILRIKYTKSLFWNYIRLIINEMNAICIMASDESMVFSTSRNSLRLKFSHPKDLSTCQRPFWGIKPVVDSGFCITSTSQA